MCDPKIFHSLFIKPSRRNRFYRSILAYGSFISRNNSIFMDQISVKRAVIIQCIPCFSLDLLDN